MYLLYNRMDSGHVTRVQVWSFCRQRTEDVADGWVLLNIAIMTFLSIQVQVLTPPLWTTCESSLLGRFHVLVCAIECKLVCVPVNVRVGVCGNVRIYFTLLKFWLLQGRWKALFDLFLLFHRRRCHQQADLPSISRL